MTDIKEYMNTLDEVRAWVTIITAQRCHDQIRDGDEISRKRSTGLWRWCLFAVMVGCFGAATLVDGSTANSGFAEGQEWSAKSSTQSAAKVIIGRIEPWRNKIAVHVSIVDIPASQEMGALHISEIAHIPFEESALAASVDKIIATGVAPARDFDSGYKQWKEHNGGIFTVPIAEAMALGR
jgi:hypothetical protein